MPNTSIPKPAGAAQPAASTPAAAQPAASTTAATAGGAPKPADTLMQMLHGPELSLCDIQAVTGNSRRNTITTQNWQTQKWVNRRGPPWTGYIAMDAAAASQVKEGSMLTKDFFRSMGRFIACRYRIGAAIQLATSTVHNHPEDNPWRDAAQFFVLQIVFDWQYVHDEMQRPKPAVMIDVNSLRIDRRWFELSRPNGVLRTAWTSWSRTERDTFRQNYATGAGTATATEGGGGA